MGAHELKSNLCFGKCYSCLVVSECPLIDLKVRTSASSIISIIDHKSLLLDYSNEISSPTSTLCLTFISGRLVVFKSTELCSLALLEMFEGCNEIISSQAS